MKRESGELTHKKILEGRKRNLDLTWKQQEEK